MRPVRFSLASAALGSLALAACGALAAPSHATLAPSDMTPTFAVMPAPAIGEGALDAQAASGQTVPFWRGKETSPLHPHHFATTMVGASPFAHPPRSTTVPVVVIVARVRFSDGTVFDPTQPSACDPVAPVTRFLNSPLFQATPFTSNGVDVSTGVKGGDSARLRLPARQLLVGGAGQSVWRRASAGRPTGGRRYRRAARSAGGQRLGSMPDRKRLRALRPDQPRLVPDDH